MIQVKVQGVAELAAALEKIRSSSFRRYFSEQFYQKRLKPELLKQPRPRRAPMHFESDKQRRYFFAALSRNQIKVPYERTNTLRQSWSFYGNADGGVVTNRALYAMFVLGSPGQSRYHERWWRTIDEIAADAAGNRLDALVQESIEKWLRQNGVEP